VTSYTLCPEQKRSVNRLHCITYGQYTFCILSSSVYCVRYCKTTKLGNPIWQEMNSVKFNMLHWMLFFDRLVDYGLKSDRSHHAMKPLQCTSNTVTVTKKGCVIIRLSWSKQVQWTADLEATILQHASLLIHQIRLFC
jgi:hypothetical protein